MERTMFCCLLFCVLVTFLTTACAAASAAPSLPASLLLSLFPESFLLSSFAASDESSGSGGLPVVSSTQSATALKGKVFLRYAGKLRPPCSHGKIVGDLAATGKYSYKGLESSPSECYVVEKMRVDNIRSGGAQPSIMSGLKQVSWAIRAARGSREATGRPAGWTMGLAQPGVTFESTQKAAGQRRRGLLGGQWGTRTTRCITFPRARLPSSVLPPRLAHLGPGHGLKQASWAIRAVRGAARGREGRVMYHLRSWLLRGLKQASKLEDQGSEVQQEEGGSTDVSPFPLPCPLHPHSPHLHFFSPLLALPGVEASKLKDQGMSTPLNSGRTTHTHLQAFVFRLGSFQLALLLHQSALQLHRIVRLCAPPIQPHSDLHRTEPTCKASNSAFSRFSSPCFSTSRLCRSNTSPLPLFPSLPIQPHSDLPCKPHSLTLQLLHAITLASDLPFRPSTHFSAPPSRHHSCHHVVRLCAPERVECKAHFILSPLVPLRSVFIVIVTLRASSAASGRSFGFFLLVAAQQPGEW
ncbi:unnamed protein product [Closterium sp. Naga37s-1]|nr:unnamed protein product [Closterium sp. Naga37s-1]